MLCARSALIAAAGRRAKFASARRLVALCGRTGWVQILSPIGRAAGNHKRLVTWPSSAKAPSHATRVAGSPPQPPAAFLTPIKQEPILTKELQFFKAERERLQGELNALAKKRTKLSDTSQLAGAEKVLLDFNALE